MILPGEGTTGRSLTSASGTRSSVSGGSASTSDGVSRPSSTTSRSGRTTSSSISPANRRPPSRQLANRTPGSSGAQRAQADVEVAGGERSFGAVLVSLRRQHQRLLHGADGVVVEVGVAGEEHHRDERLVPVGGHLVMDVRRAPRMLVDRGEVPAD